MSKLAFCNNFANYQCPNSNSDSSRLLAHPPPWFVSLYWQQLGRNSFWTLFSSLERYWSCHLIYVWKHWQILAWGPPYIKCRPDHLPWLRGSGGNNQCVPKYIQFIHVISAAAAFFFSALIFVFLGPYTCSRGTFSPWHWMKTSLCPHEIPSHQEVTESSSITLSQKAQFWFGNYVIYSKIIMST